jgi:hypothetical protein
MGESLHKIWTIQGVDEMGTMMHTKKNSGLGDKRLLIDK